ncbi:hypothetical protein LX73_2317 [Fodinibius salinus]|uniref:Uncharacterized protein n=1 Tax=Fodinibius salinus TaxID=860790 RepID=A0A5D3YG03_9BACT|nr:hypothetical protein [Fodinibius salinus]TYP92071.1 hypothetical protein LX73_2317 [Fodinibius salinus]
MYKFPEFTPEEVQERINKMWDMSGPVPLPKFDLQCGFCGHEEVLIKHLRYHMRNKNRSSNPHRCDVGMKCTLCSAVWQHGLVVPEEKHPGRDRIYGWRWIKEQMQEADV